MSDDEEKQLMFHQMNIDDRILKGIARLCWVSPTLIQEKAIPLILEGKDVLIRARTGSGKTAAFSIPVIQKILNSKKTATKQLVKALIIAPSKELCQQIYSVIIDLTIKCSREVRCVDISQQTNLAAQRPLLQERPDIVISTPARVLAHLKVSNIDLKQGLDTLVIDEADLVFSFGYENDLKEVLNYMPNIYNAILASATLSEDVISLKQLVLNNPVVLKLQEPALAPATQLQHYHLAAEEPDKACLIYALLKLHLIRGKSIIFVNTVDRCYKIKLYLEQFGIPSCVLNSELPATVRVHSVKQFNMGIYDIIIASDEHALENPGGSALTSNTTSKRKKDKESGVARGVDFQHVSNVINFDFPLDVNSYVHRAGRTARGNNEGSVLSFMSMKERELMENVEKHLQTGDTADISFKAYQFKLDELEAFKYRAKDAWKAVTRIAVRESRLKEIKHELYNSEKLKGYFEDNPHEIKILRHDKALHTVKVQSHLKDVPDYIIPESLKNLSDINRKRKRKDYTKESKGNKKYTAKQSNPLISLEIPGMSSKKK